MQRRIACRSILHERAERPVSRRLRAIGGEYGDIRQIFPAAADKISPLGQQPQLVLEIRQRHPELDTELIGRNRAVIRSKQDVALELTTAKFAIFLVVSSVFAPKSISNASGR